MLSTDKIWFRRLMFFISLSVLFFSCSSNQPLAPEVQAFRDQMFEDFNILESRLIPALEKNKPDVQAAEVIKNFLLELKSNNQRIFGIGLLDISGEYLTGYVIENNTTGKLIKDKYKDMNFHSFEVVEQIIKSKKVMQEQLYLRDARILAIGFPIIKEGDLLGILCFTFKSFEFEKNWGINEKEFLEIEFDKI